MIYGERRTGLFSGNNNNHNNNRLVYTIDVQMNKLDESFIDRSPYILKNDFSWVETIIHIHISIVIISNLMV